MHQLLLEGLLGPLPLNVSLAVIVAPTVAQRRSLARLGCLNANRPRKLSLDSLEVVGDHFSGLVHRGVLLLVDKGRGELVAVDN